MVLLAVLALVRLAAHPRVVAIGETGLDYYRLKGDLEWQRERFRTHVRAARRARKPLVVHTRAAAGDTLRILREEGAEEVRVGEGEPKRLELMGSSSPGLASWRTLGGAGEVVPVSGLGGAIAPGSDGKLL